MGRIIGTILIFVVCGFSASSQTYNVYSEAYTKDKLERILAIGRYYGVEIMDSCNNVIAKTDPIYVKVRCCNDVNVFAVCSKPEVFAEDGSIMPTSECDWKCLDSNLKEIFLFPKGTKEVFLYSEAKVFVYEFPYDRQYENPFERYGAISISGQEVFSKNYRLVYALGEHIIAARSRQSDEYEDLIVLTIKNQNEPRGNRELLIAHIFITDWWTEVDNDWFNYIIMPNNESDIYLDAFWRGVAMEARLRFEEAQECFKLAMESNDETILKHALFNLNNIEAYLGSNR